MAPGRSSSQEPPGPQRPPSLDFEGAEAELRQSAELEPIGLLHRSSNYTFLVRMRSADCVRLAIYKPARGESPLWDFPAGTLYRREVAAYEVSRALGWPPIPPTVVKEEGPHGVGALQWFVEADLTRHYLGLAERPEAVWLPVALFDIVINNADRKSGHCLFDLDGSHWMIDHGLTFHREPKLRTVIWDFEGRPVPAHLANDLDRIRGDLDGGKLGLRLKGLLSGPEVTMLKRRVAAALQPGWRFPGPDSGWSVPWPVV